MAVLKTVSLLVPCTESVACSRVDTENVRQSALQSHLEREQFLRLLLLDNQSKILESHPSLETRHRDIPCASMMTVFLPVRSRKLLLIFQNLAIDLASILLTLPL